MLECCTQIIGNRLFFFFNDTATTEIYTLSYTTLFRSIGSLRITVEVAEVLRYKMGRPTGLEPATPRSTILCSNQLSYDRRKSKERGLSRPLKVLSTRFPVVSGRHAAKTVPRVNAAPAPRNVQYRARAGANPDPGAHLAAQASRKSEADRGPPRQGMTEQ